MKNVCSCWIALIPLLAAACADLADPASTSETTGDLVASPPPVEPGQLPPTPPSIVTPAAGAVGPTHEIVNCDGRLEDFRYSASASLEHRWQTSPGGSWSGWASLGGALLFGDIALFRNADCKIEVFGTGTNHQVYDTWQTAPSAGPWHTWASIGGFATSAPWPAIDTAGDPGVCVFGSDNNIWCNLHTSPGSSPWTGWFRA